MFEFKLQVGCFLTSIFFLISYFSKILKSKNIEGNKYFYGLLIAGPIGIIFDGLTAWMVNHRDTVSELINLLTHGLFFIFMVIIVLFIFLYMFNLTIGIKKKREVFFMTLPSIITILIVIGFLPKLYYVDGVSTSYSMGISPIVCFGLSFFYFLVLFIFICIKHKNIERNKKVYIFSYLCISMIILLIQIVFPEILITSLIPMISILVIYINFENPPLIRLKQYNEDMVTGFATLVENRDNSTGGHIKRTKGYVQIILAGMKKNPKYYSVLSKDYIQNVIDSAPMHDIGKISTPDYILQKPGKLTNEEYEIMKQHASVGGDIVRETFKDIESPEYQNIVYEVARFHHEKWNGTGYPDNLSEENIPLHSRIMAIADVFDAVSSKRCYRDEMPLDVCFKIIEDGAGKDFDPDLVKIFLDSKDKVIDYYKKNH